MKRFVLPLLAVLLVATAAVAQQPAEARQAYPADPPVTPACSAVTTFTAGIADNFAQPADPTVLSPALQAYFQNNNLLATRSNFDTPGCDKHFGHSIRLNDCRECGVCGATLELRVKSCNTSLASNDAYYVGRAPFTGNNLIASGPVWSTGLPGPKTITVAIPPAKWQQLFCTPGTPAFIDVYIQDDTIVDSIKLTVTRPLP
jgi:hypothetical protein